jgi:formate-dependent nitrite reductase membrane component NrfD
MPMPPSRAIAIASSDSVTVSIAAESIGMFNLILRVSRVETFTSLGKTFDFAGTSNISSKVIAFSMILLLYCAIANIAKKFSKRKDKEYYTN